MAASFKVPENIRVILKAATLHVPDSPCAATPFTLQLVGQLDRKDYVAVMKVLEGAGGKWDKKKGLHTFSRDPRVELDLAVEAGQGVNLQQKFQAFFTPDALADRVVELADLGSGSLTVLEPSCGDGALVRAVRRASSTPFIYGYEVNAESLAKAGLYGNGEVADFLTIHRGSQCFDRVVMNPPFTRGQDAQHVAHALTFLKPGGRLVAVMTPNALTKSTGPYKALHDMLDPSTDAYALIDSEKVDGKTFKDTDIETLIAVIDRVK